MVQPDGRYAPCISAVPMGFSWAFYWAQEALRCIVRRALPDAIFLTDYTLAPPLPSKRPLVMIYADNGTHLGCDADQ
eukprot:8927905-Lingulodinium_polyedra.AAC.1